MDRLKSQRASASATESDNSVSVLSQCHVEKIDRRNRLRQRNAEQQLASLRTVATARSPGVVHGSKFVPPQSLTTAKLFDKYSTPCPRALPPRLAKSTHSSAAEPIGLAPLLQMPLLRCHLPIASPFPSAANGIRGSRLGRSSQTSLCPVAISAFLLRPRRYYAEPEARLLHTSSIARGPFRAVGLAASLRFGVYVWTCDTCGVWARRATPQGGELSQPRVHNTAMNE